MNVKGVQCCVVLFLMQNEGSVQDMRRNLIIKAFVLGAVGCNLLLQEWQPMGMDKVLQILLQK